MLLDAQETVVDAEETVETVSMRKRWMIVQQ